MTDIPHNKKGPLADTRDGNVSQKTCAYGTEVIPKSGAEQERPSLTGASRSTETKREARRSVTSELGPHEAVPAGLPAPAGLPQPIVALFDYPADDDPDWDELTARVAELAPADRETVLELTERVLGRMGL